LQAALCGEYKGAPVELTDEVRELIRQFTSQSIIPLPESINAQLRPYQERGFSWMYRNMKIGFGSIIADDMGLGKTLQVITLLAKMKEEGAMDKKKALVVVPTGLLHNWQSEVKRFAPQLTTGVLSRYGAGPEGRYLQKMLTSSFRHTAWCAPTPT
jgi:SNF2 family DNA or RNA helicase